MQDQDLEVIPELFSERYEALGGLEKQPAELGTGMTRQAERDALEHESDVFDQQDLLQRLMGDRELAGVVVTGFLLDTPRQLRSLAERQAKNDAAGIRRGAHSLKGAAATISARALRDAAQRLEDGADVNDVDRAAQLLTQANDQFERLVSRLNNSDWVQSVVREEAS